MATTVKEGSSVEVNTIVGDWDWGVSGNTKDKDPKLASITFVPGSANDKLVVKDGSDAGPVIFSGLCLTVDEKVQYYHGARKRPLIDFNLCVFSAGHKVLIDLWPSKR